MLQVNSELLQPRCENLLNSLFNLDKCSYYSDGKCKEEVTVVVSVYSDDQYKKKRISELYAYLRRKKSTEYITFP